MQEDVAPTAPLDGDTPLDSAGRLRADTLAASMVLLLALAVLQRGIGFLREILFCRWLDAEQLGQWDMAFGFSMLAAPLAVLSLPGTFGRYVERYRQRGQLRMFLRRTGLACGVLSLAAATVICLARRTFSAIVFNTPDESALVVVVGAGLLAVIAFNYFITLFTALRTMRIVSGMELANGLFFAVLGIGLMRWRPTAGSVVAAYAGACLLCSLGGLFWLARYWHKLPETTEPPPQRKLWRSLAPFAGWILVVNLLVNFFDYAPRSMILHWLPGSPEHALAEVGNYRSARVVPLLLASITAMIATMITPHLSHDWEAGRRERVSARLNLLLKTWSAVLTAVAVTVLWAAPWLFQVAFRGKYSGGLAVLPWTLTYCAWFGLAMIAQKYLWCAERAGLASLAFGAGLALNVGLSYLLLPRLGLPGAVLATAAANFAALTLMVLLSQMLGFRAERSTWAMLALPLAACLGPWLAALALGAVVLEAVMGNHLLSGEEKGELLAGLRPYLGCRWNRSTQYRVRSTEYESPV